MKLNDILKTASGNLLQSKLRTFLTVIAIFIGAMTLTLTNGIGAGISDYIDRQVNSIGAKDVLAIQVKMTTGSPVSSEKPKEYDPERTVSNSGMGGMSTAVLTQKDLDKIKAIKGIKEITPIKAVSVDYITGPSKDKYQAQVTTYVDGTNIDLAAGKLPNNASQQPEFLLPITYVDVLGFENPEDAVGKTVSFGITNALKSQKEITATVVGVQRKTFINGGGANMNRTLTGQLFDFQSEGLPEAFREQFGFAVARYDTSMSDADLTKLKTTLSEAGYTAQTIDDQIGIVKSIISAIVTVFNLFGIIALIAASFGVINTLLMSVQERTKEIGLMKSMGMSGGKIFLLFSTEAVLLGFWGSLFGVLVARGIGTIANKIASNGFLKDFDGLQLLTFPLSSILTIMGVIMFIAFLAGTLPARRAAKLNPIDALRYE